MTDRIQRHGRLISLIPKLLGCCAMVASTSGGFFNPGLINFVGGNPAASITPPPGYVVVLSVNRATSQATFTTVVNTTNGDVRPGALFMGPSLFVAESYACGVSSVTIESVELADGGAVEFVSPLPGDTGPRPFIGGINLRCGAVISVIVEPNTADDNFITGPIDGDPPQFRVRIEDFQ